MKTKFVKTEKREKSEKPHRFVFGVLLENNISYEIVDSTKSWIVDWLRVF